MMTPTNTEGATTKRRSALGPKQPINKQQQIERETQPALNKKFQGLAEGKSENQTVAQQPYSDYGLVAAICSKACIKERNMRKAIAQKLAQAEAKQRQTQATQEALKAQPKAPASVPVPAQPAPAEPTPEQVIEQVIAREKSLVPRDKSGQFVKRNSEQAKDQRQERAIRLEEQLGQLAETPVTELVTEKEIKEHSLNPNDVALIAAARKIIQQTITTGAGKEASGIAAKAKALDTIAKLLSVGPYEKRDKVKGFEITGVFIAVPEHMKNAKIETQEEYDRRNTPLTKPSWARPEGSIEGEVVPPRNTSSELATMPLEKLQEHFRKQTEKADAEAQYEPVNR
jgi:hypothetical protein